eukprot:CAMPEP_0172168846 /NCGR_PEP_ID=MMETSP1050-20130122/10375_1 /TAXON_ID=233186 /ORGANISM="Cryptomonas curvata, Strain CCAP979/52" /LENGTH=96 /DNA_ID=CAMNT_0012839835 /DNA_START=320 /DNA_END=606 /DNA_ORIENTATION=-
MGNNSGKVVGKKSSGKRSSQNSSAAYSGEEYNENGGCPDSSSGKPVRAQSAAIPVASSAVPAPIPGGKAAYQRPKGSALLCGHPHSALRTHSRATA